ncbi:MAG TPA: alpha/beta fold hydrolase [Acidimicrobiales bacterium]|nr:alpha/beta fold hydrolase [Acidimicrobiales bacterium]
MTRPTPPLDPAAFGPSLARLAAGLAVHPLNTAAAGVRLGSALAVAGAETAARAVGWDGDTALAPAAGDRRFSDPAWEHNPWFFGQRQAYLAWERWLKELAAAARLDGKDAEKARMALGLLADALAPTNFLVGHPAAMRKAVETRGASVVGGLANFLRDVAANNGKPRQVDSSQFEVGVNLACTTGKVVYRNDLVELIQYEPQTETVYDTPLVLSPPWINRYYIMDLAPGRSFAEWAVTHGHTTFALSWRNPDASMRGVGLDDYMRGGLLETLRVVSDITGAPELNIVGLCVGGTLAVMLGAWLAHDGDRRIRSVTLLNTLVDFSEPGPLASFTDPAAIAGVERRMAEQGFLDGREMAGTFDALRANDLVFNYVAPNWLMGETPPAFDILAWNADSTRVPEAAHSGYLRSCYLGNELAKGTMTLGGRVLDPHAVESDAYLLAAEKDHITPWKSSYATTHLLGGKVRFVLTSAGHIAGIVNPPGPKRKHWTNPALPPTADAWLEGATEHPGTWWDDWTDWARTRAGRRRPPPPLGSDAHPVLGDAPGTYVHG